MTAGDLPSAFDLAGKTAVVTGGAGLLGPRHAAALMELGAHVVLADIDLDGAEAAVEGLEARRNRGGASALHLDVTDRASVEAAREAVLTEQGDLHILVNNAAIDAKVEAGGLAEPTRFEDFSLARWQRALDVGLTGAFLCAQVLGGCMAARADRGGGVILNIASDLSVIAPDQRLYREEGVPEAAQPVKPVSYSVVKTGLIGLTRYLAAYWAGAGVRVNALSPGGVYSGQPEAFVRRLSDLIPLGRMAEADEYGAAVQFLCAEASRYMTGQNIVIDGGRTIV